MIHSDRRLLALATCLSALAGYVDAIGFIELGGFFVSFMSGNTTRAGVGLASDTHEAAIALGLIGAFVGGVLGGSLLGRTVGHGRRQLCLLSLVAMLLALAALGAASGMHTAGIALMAMAMGAENVVFENEGDVPFGLTYMTGALVKLGQRLAALPFGGERYGWFPYLALWLGLLAGATFGALAQAWIGMNGLWVAALLALAMGPVAAHLVVRPS